MKAIFFVAACVGAIPSVAVAQGAQSERPPSDADLAAAIENARAARADAQAAMERADQALEALEELQSRREANASDEIASDVEGSSGTPASSDMPTVNPDPLVDLNGFVRDRLKITRPQQYKSTDVALQSSVQSVEDNFEAKATWALRYAPVNDGEIASHLRLTLGGFAAKGSDGSTAAIYDFDEIANGAGLLAGVEFGQYPEFKPGERAKIVREGVEAARRACIEDRAYRFSANSATVDYGAAIRACAGDGLWNWVAKERQQTTWSEIAGKLYRTDGTLPQWTIGAEVRYGFDRTKYLTPADLAAIVPETDFDTLEDTVTKADFDPFSVKLALGLALRQPEDIEKPVNIVYDMARSMGAGLVLSVAYRKDYEYPKDTGEQDICLLVGSYSQCREFNIAAPVKVDEFVPGAQLNLLLPRYGWLPSIGIGPKLTYATQTDRLGVDFPVYLAADKDGNLTGGLKYFYRSAGEGTNGADLESEHGVGLFIGTKFDLLSGR